jgi:curved DNA-binding protein CbpA
LNRVDSNEDRRLPRPVEGVDVRALPIGPEEAFVLSRIDGTINEADLVTVTGLAEARVHESLERLFELGAIRFANPSARPSHPSPPVRRDSAKPFDPTSSVQLPLDAARPAEQRPLYDSAALDELVDLDLNRKKQILETESRLESLNHYQLLGVDPSADKRDIKAKYFAVVNIYHPDRYYGKKLGSYKARLEKTFARLTEAHDTLTRTATRAEYDTYLEAQRRTRDFEQLIASPQADAAEITRVQEQIAARVAQSTSPPISPPGSGRERRSSERFRVEALDPEQRKLAMARKLSGASRSVRASQVPTPISPQALQQKATEDLKQRYEDRLKSARHQQVDHFTQAADLALAENRPMSALNALRIAVSLSPENEMLHKRMEQIKQLAYVDMAKNFAQQAVYEERTGRFLEAARSYERAALGNAQAKFFERAAACLLEGSGDLRKAAEHAKQAVTLEPGTVPYRLTLGRVFLAAGMKSSAVAEFERAAALAPGDASIQDWLKRAKQGET